MCRGPRAQPPKPLGSSAAEVCDMIRGLSCRLYYHHLAGCQVPFYCVACPKNASSTLFNIYDASCTHLTRWWSSGRLCLPEILSFRQCERLCRSHWRKTEALGGLAALQSSRLDANSVI